MTQSLSIVKPEQDHITEVDIVNKKQLFTHPLVILGCEMLLALPLGFLLTKLRMGGMAWLFGGLLSGVIVLQLSRLYAGHVPKPNRATRRVGMALVGLNVGFTSAGGHLGDVATCIPIFVSLTLFLLLSGGFIGYIYSRISKTNIFTAMLATTPGGVGLMSALAADYNKNVSLVALVQSLRVTAVVMLIPFIARVSYGTYTNPQTSYFSADWFHLDFSYLGLILLSLLLDGLGVYLAILCKLPAAEFFGAFLVGLGFNPLLNLLPFVDHLSFVTPPVINLIGQILLGIAIGESWGKQSAIGKKTIGYAFVSVSLTLVAGAIAALLAMQLTSWDWLTCLLVTAPGGAAEMILVALAFNHNVEVVTAGHLIRLIAINSSIPVWLFFFRRLESQLADPG